MTFIQTVAPTATPVTLTEAKNHLRVDHDTDDDLITTQIWAATEKVEEFTGRQLVSATWLLTLDCFPKRDQPIILPRPPASTVTSITYTKSDETTATVPAADYVLDNQDTLSRHRIILKDAASWPADTRDYAAVRVLYTAGYGTPAAVPSAYKVAIKLLVGSMYEHRESMLVGSSADELPTLEALLRNRRVDL